MAASPSTLSSLPTFITTHAKRQPLLAISTLLALPLTSYIISSYRGFLALGQGGLPHNLFGWALQALLQPLGRHDTTSPSPFSDPGVFATFAPHGRTSFLSLRDAGAQLPIRAGSRPTVPSYIAPQRQTTDCGDAALIARMNAHLAALAAKSPDQLTIRPSKLEAPDSPALWLAAAPLPSFLARSTRGEIAHVHPEASTHLVLSLADAEEATAKGWAQRHKLSGVLKRGPPLSYVMVYAPRDESEFGVWAALVDACVAFNTAPQS